MARAVFQVCLLSSLDSRVSFKFLLTSEKVKFFVGFGHGTVGRSVSGGVVQGALRHNYGSGLFGTVFVALVRVYLQGLHHPAWGWVLPMDR